MFRSTLPLQVIDGVVYVGQYYGMKSYQGGMQRLQRLLQRISEVHPLSIYGDNWYHAQPQLHQFYRGYCDLMDLWSVYGHSIVLNTTKKLDYKSRAINLRPMETWASGGILWSDSLPPEFDAWYIPLGKTKPNDLRREAIDEMMGRREEIRRMVCERYNYHAFVDKLLRITQEC